MWRRASIALAWLFLIVSFVFGSTLNCSCEDLDDDDIDPLSEDDDDVGDDDVADDDSVVEPFSLAGEVFIVPVYYEQDENENWNRVELDWLEDIGPDGYTGGMIYVGITESFGVSDETLFDYTASDVPADPANEGTPYEFAPISWPEETVYVMGIADTRVDGVISSWDDMAFAPDPVDTTGAPVDDIDVIIDVEYVDSSGTWTPGTHGGGGGNGGGGGGGGYPGEPCEDVSLSGDVFLQDSPYTGSVGDVMVALYDSNGDGPYWMDYPGQLDGDDQGVMLPFEFDIYCNFTANIWAAWDWNDNGLYEPGDQWGATVAGQYGEELNPWAITDIDVVGLMVRVPVDGAGQAMPAAYVKVSGEVTTDGTFNFGDVDPMGSLYILAGKHNLPDLSDYPVWVLLGEDKVWSSQTTNALNQEGHEVDYEVWVPSNSNTVLYALIDEDGDGYIELSYEMVSGPIYLSTGTSNIVQDVELTDAN